MSENITNHTGAPAAPDATGAASPTLTTCPKCGMTAMAFICDERGCPVNGGAAYPLSPTLSEAAPPPGAPPLDILALRIRTAVEGECGGFAIGFRESLEIAAYALTGMEPGSARDAALVALGNARSNS